MLDFSPSKQHGSATDFHVVYIQSKQHERATDRLVGTSISSEFVLPPHPKYSAAMHETTHTHTHTNTWNIVMGALTTTHNRFSGRSNVGKSSLINAVCRQHGLARTSKVCAVVLFFKI